MVACRAGLVDFVVFRDPACGGGGLVVEALDPAECKKAREKGVPVFKAEFGYFQFGSGPAIVHFDPAGLCEYLSARADRWIDWPEMATVSGTNAG